MKIFCFDAGVGQRVEQFVSSKVSLSGIARLSTEAQVSYMHIGGQRGTKGSPHPSPLPPAGEGV